MQVLVPLFGLVFLFLAQPTAAAGGYTCATAGICANNGTCSAGFGSNPTTTSCSCLTGFSGAQCQFREIIDCNGNSAPDVWVGDGICNNGNMQYASNWISFNCATYNSDGGDCGANGPSATGHGACSSNPCGTGKCFGSDTKYWCSCPRNTAGANCQATVDGCASSPCNNGARCISDITKAKNFLCVCKGFYYDTTCSTAFPSGGGGASATCTPSCTNGDCIVTNYCSCNTGYYGTGTTCTLNTACASNPCANGGTCKASATDNTFSCTCASGYSGTTCSTTVPACFPNPCQNGGTCAGASGSAPYSCTCDPTHNGLNCTFSSSQFDCATTTPVGFPSVFVGDGICENSWTYLGSSSFTVPRYSMADCKPRGDADCPSELDSGSARVVFNVFAFVMMTVLAVFVL